MSMTSADALNVATTALADLSGSELDLALATLEVRKAAVATLTAADIAQIETALNGPVHDHREAALRVVVAARYSESIA